MSPGPSTPLRVLTIGHSYVVGLNQAVPATVASNPDVDLTLAAPEFHYGDLRRIHLETRSSPHYRIVPLPARLTRWNHGFWYSHGRLRRLVREGGFHVVHAWEEPYVYAGYQIACAAAGAGVPLVFRTAQSLIKRYPWPFRRFERYVVSHAAAWVAGGQLVYQAMVQKGFPAATGGVITLGVDTEAFRPLAPEARTATAQSLGLEPPIVGFLGRLVPAKGLDLLMAALDGTRQQWSLLVLGSGPYQGRIEAWVKQRGLRDRVRILLARHDEVPGLLGAMDLLLAPSQTTRTWKEQFGRMIIEAFACGVPVVGSDSGEIPHVIGDAGVVLPERDVEAWSRTIDLLVADPARRGSLAERGLARCRARFSIHRVAGQWLELYRSAAAASPRFLA